MEGGRSAFLVAPAVLIAISGFEGEAVDAIYIIGNVCPGIHTGIAVVGNVLGIGILRVATAQEVLAIV